MTAAMRIRARHSNGLTEVLLLMTHPMETGLRRNAAGEFIPAHHITDAQVTVEGRLVFQARMSQAVSQDPLLAFRFRGAQPGDRLVARWIDNRGGERIDELSIPMT